MMIEFLRFQEAQINKGYSDYCLKSLAAMAVEIFVFKNGTDFSSWASLCMNHLLKPRLIFVAKCNLHLD